MKGPKHASNLSRLDELNQCFRSGYGPKRSRKKVV
jgi:hypothetical protein